ncbi:flavin reductase family protein [Brevundimonas mediterranea]
MANTSCRVEQTAACGTHVAMIGRIVDVQLAQDGASLVY